MGRFGAFCRRNLALPACALLCACAFATPLYSGNGLVREMVAAYRSARTIQDSSTATVRTSGNVTYYQKSSLILEKPNRLRFMTQDPQLGAVEAVSDGSTLTVYMSRQNVYVSQAAPASIPLEVARISAAARAVLNDPIDQVLNPLSFLCGGAMPSEAHEFVRRGAEKIEGKTAILVESPADLAWVRRFLAFTGGGYPVRSVRLWINPANKTLLQAACNIQWRGLVAPAPGKGPAAAGSGVSFTETYSSARLNAPVPAGAFQFKAPPGAQRIYPRV